MCKAYFAVSLTDIENCPWGLLFIVNVSVSEININLYSSQSLRRSRLSSAPSYVHRQLFQRCWCDWFICFYGYSYNEYEYSCHAVQYSYRDCVPCCHGIICYCKHHPFKVISISPKFKHPINFARSLQRVYFPRRFCVLRIIRRTQEDC